MPTLAFRAILTAVAAALLLSVDPLGARLPANFDCHCKAVCRRYVPATNLPRISDSDDLLAYTGRMVLRIVGGNVSR